MAYQVTKRIAGHEYRYHVASYRDPSTKKTKQRWTYLGRVDGESVIAAHQRPHVAARERISSAILQLLEKRDVSHLTVDVITRAAQVSRSTFYRFFPDKNAAILEAVASVLRDALRCPEPSQQPVFARDVERAKLRDGVRDFLKATTRFKGLRRAIEASPEIRDAFTASIGATMQENLTGHVRALSAAGAIDAREPDVLGNGLAVIVQGVGKMLVSGDAEPSDELVLSVLEIIDRAVFASESSLAG